MIRTRLDAGWNVTVRRCRLIAPRLKPAVVTFLQTQSCAVTFHQLLAETAQAAYGNPIAPMAVSRSRGWQHSNPVMLKAVQTANYHEESDHVFAPRPLPMPDDLPQQIELAVDNATPAGYVWRSSSRRMLLTADIERAVKRCLPEPVSDYHWQQQVQPLIARPGRTRLQNAEAANPQRETDTATGYGRALAAVHEHTVSERAPDDHTVCLGDRTLCPLCGRPSPSSTSVYAS